MKRRVVQRVLVAIDIAVASDATLEHAADLALAHGAELQVLYVKPSLDPREVYAPDKVPALDGQLDRMQSRFPDLKVDARHEMGDLAATIREVVEQWSSDVVVIGYSGRKEKKRLHRVMRHVPGSVYLVDIGRTK